VRAEPYSPRTVPAWVQPILTCLRRHELPSALASA